MDTRTPDLTKFFGLKLGWRRRLILESLPRCNDEPKRFTLHAPGDHSDYEALRRARAHLIDAGLVEEFQATLNEWRYRLTFDGEVVKLLMPPDGGTIRWDRLAKKTEEIERAAKQIRTRIGRFGAWEEELP